MSAAWDRNESWEVESEGTVFATLPTQEAAAAEAMRLAHLHDPDEAIEFHVRPGGH